MSDRISAAQLAEIEKRVERDDPPFMRVDKDRAALVAEVRAAWGEAEAATRALRDLVDLIDGPPITDATEVDCDVALAAARALVGSENAAARVFPQPQEGS